MHASARVDLIPKQQDHGRFFFHFTVFLSVFRMHIMLGNRKAERKCQSDILEQVLVDTVPNPAYVVTAEIIFPYLEYFVPKIVILKSYFQEGKYLTCEARKSSGMKCHVIGAVLLR